MSVYPQGPQHEISVLNSVSAAFNRMQAMLFSGFGGAKMWFLLGFVVFINNCARGTGNGGGMNFNTPNLGGGGGGGAAPQGVPEMATKVLEYWDSYFSVALLIAVAAMIFVTALGAFFAWLFARFEFILMDISVDPSIPFGVSWERQTATGWSLFLFRLTLTLINGVVGFFSLTLMLVVAGRPMLEDLAGLPPDASGGELFSALWKAGAMAFAVLLPSIVLAVGLWILQTVVHNFVLPVMFARKLGIKAAMGEVWQLFTGNPVPFVLYLLVRFCLAGVAIILFTTVTCMCCCISCLPGLGPYLLTVATLPVWLVLYYQPLCFMEQISPDYRIFPPDGYGWGVHDPWSATVPPTNPGAPPYQSHGVYPVATPPAQGSAPPAEPYGSYPPMDVPPGRDVPPPSGWGQNPNQNPPQS